MGGWYLLVYTYCFSQLKIKILFTYLLTFHLKLRPAKFVDKDLLNLLKDCVINVSERRCKNVVAQMLVVELKFA